VECIRIKSSATLVNGATQDRTEAYTITSRRISAFPTADTTGPAGDFYLNFVGLAFRGHDGGADLLVDSSGLEKLIRDGKDLFPIHLFLLRFDISPRI
jgi:hypothetical protein